MQEHEVDLLDQRYDQFLALREAFASLVYTLAEQGVLEPEVLKRHLDQGSQHLEEYGTQKAKLALTELTLELMENAELVHTVGKGRRQRAAAAELQQDSKQDA